MSKIRQFLINHANIVNRFPFNNHGLVFLKKASICGLLVKCNINNSGTGNSIFIESGSVLRNCTFNIFGNSNRIRIGANVIAINAVFYIEDNNNEIKVGDNTNICGNTEFACMEGTKIHVGKECLFSSGIHIRTGDSHSVVDFEGKRINPSKDINIGDHVWIGQRVTILKGVTVPEDCIIGIDSVVTKKFDEKHIAIAGNPAKTIKHSISWDNKRI